MVENIQLHAPGQGLHEFTQLAQEVVNKSGLEQGLCTLFVQHTSASLLVQENADPAVRNDLEQWLNRLVQENDPLYTHTNEGPDDMPGHIKSTLTATSLSIPIIDNRLALGTWQGIFLWEHRHKGGMRNIAVHIGP